MLVFLRSSSPCSTLEGIPSCYDSSGIRVGVAKSARRTRRIYGVAMLIAYAWLHRLSYRTVAMVVFCLPAVFWFSLYAHSLSGDISSFICLQGHSQHVSYYARMQIESHVTLKRYRPCVFILKELSVWAPVFHFSYLIISRFWWNHRVLWLGLRLYDKKKKLQACAHQKF